MERIIYQTEEYRGYTINFLYSQDSECPTVFWDMGGTHLWEYSNSHCLSDSCHYRNVWGKNADNRHSLEETIKEIVVDNVSEKNIRKYIKKYLKDEARFVYDRSEKEWRFEERGLFSTDSWYERFSCSPAEYREGGWVYELLENRTKDELLGMLDEYCKDIAFYEWSSTGYSQGDYFEGISFISKKQYLERVDSNPKNWSKSKAISFLEDETKYISAWAWGDVFDMEIIDAKGEEYETICNYSYGDDCIEEGIKEGKATIDRAIKKHQQWQEDCRAKAISMISKLKGMIFIGDNFCYKVDEDMFGYLYFSQADRSNGYVRDFQNQVNINDLPDDVLEQIEKAIA